MDSKLEHTPGPWHTNGLAVEHDLEDGTTVYIASVGDDDDIGGVGSGKANARLIAASPRLYDYVAMRASLGDNEAKQLLKELGYAESETTEGATS